MEKIKRNVGVSDLNGRIENHGRTDQGRYTAENMNRLVEAVMRIQENVDIIDQNVIEAYTKKTWPANFYVDETGIYRKEHGAEFAYPIAHPDISTQPGNMNVYEVALPLSDTEAQHVTPIPSGFLPDGAVIIDAKMISLTEGTKSFQYISIKNGLMQHDSAAYTHAIITYAVPLSEDDGHSGYGEYGEYGEYTEYEENTETPIPEET